MYSSNYSYRNNSSNSGMGCGTWLGIIVSIMIVIFIVGELRRLFDKVSNEPEVIATVTDKAVKNKGDEGKYLIFTETEDGEIQTFEITDSLWKGRFNSSDVYAGIKVGSTYRFTVAGSRNEFRSCYPNIYEYELIEEADGDAQIEDSEDSINDET